MDSKKCTCCGEIKPLDQFYTEKRAKDGKTSRCKVCLDIQKREYRATHKKERSEHEKKRRLTDPTFAEQAAVRNSRYYQKVKEEGGERWEKVVQNRNKNLAKMRERRPEYFMLKGAKYRSKIENLPFNLEESDIIIPEYCPILGIKLKQAEGYVSDDSPSLDKKIPKLGYVKGNVAIISYLANKMKQNATPEQLEMFAKNIIPYLKNEDIVQTTENKESVESEIKSSE
jgi:hypothetical protein